MKPNPDWLIAGRYGVIWLVFALFLALAAVANQAIAQSRPSADTTMSATSTAPAAPVPRPGPHVLRLHTFAAANSVIWQQLLLPWMQRVEKESGGQIEFDPHPRLPLNGEPVDLFEQARTGAADIVFTMPAYSPKRFQRLEAFELPFMLTNAEAVSRAYWEYVQTFAADAFKDVRPLSLHVSGPNVIHTRSRAVRSVDGLRDLRFFAGTRQAENLLGALGALSVERGKQTVSLALTEPSLDGVLAPWEMVPAAAFDTVPGFHTELSESAGALSTNAYVLVINKQAYQQLPADLRKVIDANSGIETSAWMGSTHEQSGQAGRAASAGTVITLKEDDAQPFRKAAEKVEAEWVRQVNADGFDGQKLLDGARTLIKKHTR